MKFEKSQKLVRDLKPIKGKKHSRLQKARLNGKIAALHVLPILSLRC
jgi:hypothetical protein